MKKLILTLSAAALCSFVMAQQTTVSRLIQKAIWVGTGAPQPYDSTYNIYKNTMSWDAALLKWKCDTAVTMRQSGTGYRNRTREIKKFDAQNRITEEITELYNLAGTIASPNQKHIYTYTADGKLATDESYSYTNNNWVLSGKTTNTYNAQGNIIETLLESPVAGSLVNNMRKVMTYNTSGQLETNTLYYWNAANNVWKENIRATNYYTGTRVSVTLNEDYNFTTSSWVVSDSTINTYNAKGELIGQLFRTDNMGTGILVDAMRYTYTYDANGNCIDALTQTGIPPGGGPIGPLQDWSQIITTYNSFGQPLKEILKRAIQLGDPLVPIQEHYFYYEQFNIGTGIKEQVAQDGTINVYPIPAGKTMMLDLNWNETQLATVMLFDMTGKIAGQWTTPAAKQHTQMLDISSIPSGTYMLKVMGTRGVLNRQVNIVR